MNISLNEDVIIKHGFTLSELLICLAIKFNRQRDIIAQINDLQTKNKVYESQAHHHYLRPQAERTIDEILNVSNDAPEITELDELVNKLQELFPKERKLDSHGQPRYSYRGNKRDVTERLQKFFKVYGKYSFDDVYECTKRYVERFKYDKTNMRLLPYFIMKTVDGELVSDLATELDNMDIDETTQSNNDLNYGDMLL